MAYITAAGAGNWSAGGTWNGGVVPGNGDTADLNGKVVVMDVADIPIGGGTLLALVSPATAGNLTVDMAALGDASITATTITAGTAAFISVSGAAPANTLTVTGNTTGGAGGNDWCIHILGGCTAALVHSGDISAGAGRSAWGLYTQGTGGITTVGTITGGPGRTGYGVFLNWACALEHTGNVVGSTGNNAAGIFCGEFVTSVTLNSANLIDGTGGVAYFGKSPTWTPAATEYHQIAAGRLAPEVAAGNLLEAIPNGLVVGDYHESTVAEVQLGVPFGSGSALMGLYTANTTGITGTVTQKSVTGVVT